MSRKKNLYIVLFIGFFSFCLTSLTAAVYIKENIHFDSTYVYGRATEEQETVTQWWFGDRQAALDLASIRIVLDKKAQHLLVINNRQKTYTLLPLPLKTAANIDTDSAKALELFKIEGNLEKQEKKERINQKECQLYIVNEKICDLSDTPTYENKCFYDREQKAWVTTDVTFDWRLKNELVLILRLFFNPGEGYLTDMQKLNGWCYASKNTMFLRAGKFPYSVETVEISEQEAPPGIFEAPADFQKNQTLTVDELRQIIGRYYWRGL